MLSGMQRNRLLLLAAAAAVAVVVVVVVVVVASGGSDSSSATTTEPTAAGETPTSLFAGIPQQGELLGKAGAPATLLVFEDPQCPFCREFNLNVLPSVVTDFVRTGRVKLAFRGINILGPNSDVGLRAIYAAGLQNRLWTMAEELYRRQGGENTGWITDGVVREAAAAAGAKPDAVLAAMPKQTARLAAAERESNQLGLRGTPSFYVQRPPGLPQQVQVTSLEPAAFSAALAAALR